MYSQKGLKAKQLTSALCAWILCRGALRSCTRVSQLHVHILSAFETISHYAKPLLAFVRRCQAVNVHHQVFVIANRAKEALVQRVPLHVLHNARVTGVDLPRG